MKFGLLYEAQRPFEGNDVDWNALYKETLDQCELADKVGFHNLWFVEHHFLMGFSGSPCPEVLFGALSQRTKNIRIGFGVSILPNHHPVRIAERAAMVDQLTDGRVEFGTGRSNAYEQMGQGIDPRETRDRWDEAIRMLPQIWQADEFSWEGKFWNVPTRRVLPRMYQKPHPRMYLACTQTACCLPPLTPWMSWPNTSRCTATPSKTPTRWALSSTTSGATTSTRSAGRTTRKPRSWPPNP